ncbi:helix-turn-helix transcriptional regulator [Gulosibacter molinativorax]|uniref:WYL domain-containing protein n=1 Tax=Gulosibacter molinativorax TaxID=256821 RepID=A0ABT7C4K3_9MICO|nr:WYL domain-containing protein [Gulosibacter molinativorax]MDJ1370136.1 WYL domain-containing protein [Gulosibacter molinativorax]QUY61547.1 Hypotetical protein [Gulosibacter molinativorax]
MAGSSTSARALSPNHERQVRLLLRILESERPLTAAEIYQSVDEYRARYERDGNNSSLEKMFERDRNALAQTGIEIGTVPDPTAPGDRARWRYQVSEDVAGGAVVELTADELLLVDQATTAWLDPSLKAGARQAFVKLLGQADSGGETAASSPRTVVSTHPLFGALRDAVAHRKTIRFEYRKLGSIEVESRVIDALGLFSHHGRWLINGFDHARQAPRNFLLARILSDVTEIDTHDRAYADQAAITATLDEIARQQPVTVAVKARSQAEASLRARARTEALGTSDVAAGDWYELVITDWDLGVLADELAGYGTMIRVIDPPEVADGVRARLQRMLDAHQDRQE